MHQCAGKRLMHVAAASAVTNDSRVHVFSLGQSEPKGRSYYINIYMCRVKYYIFKDAKREAAYMYNVLLANVPYSLASATICPTNQLNDIDELTDTISTLNS